MDQPGKVAPIYLVVEHSASMEPYSDSLEAAINKVILTIKSIRFLGDIIRISIVSFGSCSGTLLPLCDVNNCRFSEMLLQALDVMGVTDYRYVLEELCARIEGDVTTLRAERFKILRPTVIFLTNGIHCGNTNRWLPSRQKLIDSPWRANIVAFGIGPSREETLKLLSTTDRVGKPLAFICHGGDMSPANSVVEIVMGLFESHEFGGPDFHIEEPELPVPPGFRKADMEII